MLNTKLVELRKALGWNQSEFAKIIDINVSLLNRYESGNIEISSKFINKIIRITKVNPSKLFELPTDEISNIEELEPVS